MVLSDTQIIERCEKGMITPYDPKQVTQLDPEQGKLISFGTSSYGYDIRLADEYKIFRPHPWWERAWAWVKARATGKAPPLHIVDPKAFDPGLYVEKKGPVCIIPPNSFALGRSVEWFDIPRDLLTICLGKSTYARCGLIVNVTPLEPEWDGELTIEISNTTPLPAKVYAGEGIAQLLFLKGNQVCARSYRDKKGKYNGTKGVVGPKL